MVMTITEKILARAAGRKNQISKIKMQNDILKCKNGKC
jgi:hypothetical protein